MRKKADFSLPFLLSKLVFPTRHSERAIIEAFGCCPNYQSKAQEAALWSAAGLKEQGGRSASCSFVFA